MELPILDNMYRIDKNGVRHSLNRQRNPCPEFSDNDLYFYKDRKISLAELVDLGILVSYPYERVNRRHVRHSFNVQTKINYPWVTPYHPVDSSIQFDFIKRKDYQKNEAIINTIKKFYPDNGKPVKFIVPGDGIIPKTGLFLAHYFPESTVHSIDPQRRQFNYLLGEKDLTTYNLLQTFNNLDSQACTWENFLSCNVSL